ncbi:MAG: hypothetical protein K0R75_165 [Paenibacillaceae bacterium]|jgi:response regulator RpfG family c-di-GMP phosphodiesterase|nr:hypothetical protein [Paenibacillaceae bacterium]
MLKSEGSQDDDLLIFAEEEEEVGSLQGTNAHQNKWKIIIADDDKEIHRVTSLVLGGFEFEGEQVELISAYSGEETMQLIAEHPDTAIMLLDVVMEEEHSGLNVIRYVREQLKNTLVRIILRTGQPGQAPEKTVIVNYDINDYKEKTELTAQKLFTSVISALRSYRDLKIIEKNKQGLEEIIKSSATLFKIQSMQMFSIGVLTQLTSLLRLDRNVIHCSDVSGIALTRENRDCYILAAIGDYSKSVGMKAADVLPEYILNDIQNAYRLRQSIYYDNRFACYFQGKNGSENVIYFCGVKKLTEFDRYLVEIYCANVSVAFENIYLNEELENSQREIIFTMGEITEHRSSETGSHVKRVAEFSKLLALKYGLSESQAEILHLASPMHDVGKAGIPDAILNKPGRLTEEEFEVMKTHTTLGFSMLKHSNKEILKSAAVIALQHHEKFDGNGYPQKLSGENIHIFGRITAVADVFDALLSERVYKKAWPLEKIIDYYKEQKDRHFDARLVDLFLDSMPEILRIRQAFAD